MSRKSNILSILLIGAAGAAACDGGPDRNEPVDLPGESPYTPDGVQPDTPPDAPPEMEPVPEDQDEMQPIPEPEPPPRR